MAKKQKAAKTKRPRSEDAGQKSSPLKDGTRTSSKKPREETQTVRREEGWRETVESIVVAFVLAFLFRTFEAEAFVIPTGSMAPTLYGRHKDIVCEKCGYRFAVGASDELVRGTPFLDPERRVDDVVCPNCRYITPAEVVNKLPVFKGDRILVVKFPYEFGEPRRWDVLVFKYPEEATTNYIKRLVGLPGEKLEIRQGDVYRQTKSGLEILRKADPDKQRALQILVHDNDHPARELLKAGWPERWAAVRQKVAGRENGQGALWQSDSDGWQADAEARSFHLRRDGKERKVHRWIRYRHFVPSEQDWDAVLQGRRPEEPLPRLITDFCGYNAYTGARMRGTRRDRGYDLDLGVHWVGDLTISCEVEIHEADKDGELLLELIEGFRTYRCRFQVANGLCEIFHFVDQSREEEEKTLGRAQTALKGPGKYRVTFANVDDRLCVWVNDRLVPFGADNSSGDGTYLPYGGGGEYQKVTRRDLSPVGIAARGCDVTVSHLVLKRDIYYRAEKYVDNLQRSEEYEYDLSAGGEGVEVPPDISRRYAAQNGRPSETEKEIRFDRLYALQIDPELWWQEYSGGEGHPRLRPARFARLGPGEYFMMGDNSPKSADSRLWPNTRDAVHRHAVPRRLLVGKAFFIYWPHGIPFLNNGKGYPLTYHKTQEGQKSDYPAFRIPFYPNFRRMHRIR